jgi:methyltransferase (TIGR00027 family)
MQAKQPSRTAFAVAGHRAAHQVLEDGRVFADPLAGRILGRMAAGLAVRQARRNPAQGGMRFFVAARARVAETHLAEGVAQRGVRQLVVLGAGLDTFAYRNPFEGLRVFEVDHPATQAWKRQRLKGAGIALPASLTLAPVDFERDDLMAALAANGFDPDERTFFSWLGVVPYLTKDAIAGTLGRIAALPGGGEVVFDYSDPPETLSEAARAAQKERAARVAALGEPFLSHFEPAELHAQLSGLGFARIDDLGPKALIERFMGPLPADRPFVDRGGHVLFAATR